MRLVWQYLWSMESVVLKKGKEKIFYKRHHWIFSGAIASFPDGYQDGELVSVCSSEKELLGWGFFNKKCSLSGRIVSFGTGDVYLFLKKSLLNALSLRQSLLNDPNTTAFRLINGEGDGLPGLIIDKYGPYLVVQTGTLGMRKLLPFFVELLRENLELQGIYDKSIANSLKEEGLASREEILWGEIPETTLILEEGIKYVVSLKKGQKTGFFLDQREMRKIVRSLSYKKRVFNGFCYSGGFTLAALKGGASSVDSVDISADAMGLFKENVQLNGFSFANNHFYQEDIFDFLSSNTFDYDLVILDPPAFAKKKKDLANAVKGYKKLFKCAMQKMPEGSLLFLSSCSYYLNETLFENLITQAALEARRTPRIIGRHRHAYDHPINPFHPESNYLKSLTLAL